MSSLTPSVTAAFGFTLLDTRHQLEIKAKSAQKEPELVQWRWMHLVWLSYIERFRYKRKKVIRIHFKTVYWRLQKASSNQNTLLFGLLYLFICFPILQSNHCIWQCCKYVLHVEPCMPDNEEWLLPDQHKDTAESSCCSSLIISLSSSWL